MSDISIAESKIQILYLVDRAPGVSYHLLMEKCMESLYTDFFTFSRSYEELISGNLMDKSKSGDFTGEALGSTENLTLTDGGKAVLNDLISSLSAGLIENLNDAAEEIRNEMSKNSGTKASMELIEGGKFKVNLATDNNGKPFSATVTVEDEKTAVKICKMWRKAASKAPSEFLKLFDGE
ncbi:uncharacterized protein DUF4364 [Ruminococcaceae bacterium R-25]|nr:uncharacterized protein DUF4364 [Ruminococcaceae bacterium R-25]SUQ10746.1 protein of unknown function [Oscillospiraceae bacterium]